MLGNQQNCIDHAHINSDSSLGLAPARDGGGHDESLEGGVTHTAMGEGERPDSPFFHP